MATSALFKINNKAVGVADDSVEAGDTVSLQLSSTTGVKTVSWEIFGKHSSDVTTPVITKAGTPLGITATFTIPNIAGAQAYGIKCTVNGGRDSNGSINSDLTTTSAVYVKTLNGNLTNFFSGETFEADPVLGWTSKINNFIDEMGNVIVGATPFINQVLMAGNDADGNIIKNLGQPVDDDDAIRKQDLQAAYNTLSVHANLSGLTADDHTQYLKANGTRALTGNMSMGTHNLTGVATPQYDDHATNKVYVDTAITTLQEGATAYIDYQIGEVNDKIDGYGPASATKYGYVPPVTSDNYVLKIVSGTPEWSATGGGTGVTDHGDLTGLADNDHPQYALKTYVDGYNGWKDANIASGANIAVNKLAAGTNGYVLQTVSGIPAWTVKDTIITDHGLLSGLSDNDHPQYALSSALNSYATIAYVDGYSPNHNTLQNLTVGDPHTQYALKSYVDGYGIATTTYVENTLEDYATISYVDGYSPNHATLQNLTVGDPHTQYLLADGSRVVEGNKFQALSGAELIYSTPLATNSGDGGDIIVRGQDCTGLNGVAGDVQLYGGNAISQSGGYGGNIVIAAGTGTAWSGDLTLAVSGADVGHTAGDINLVLNGSNQDLGGAVNFKSGHNPPSVSTLVQIKDGEFKVYTDGYFQGLCQVQTPVNPEDAATKAYVDAHSANVPTGSANTIYTSDGVSNNWLKITDGYIDADADIAVSKLAAGTESYVIKTVSGVPTWAAESGGGSTPTGDENTAYLSNGSSNFFAQITDAYIASGAGIQINKLASDDPNMVLITDVDGNPTFGGITTSHISPSAGITATQLAIGGAGAFLQSDGATNLWSNNLQGVLYAGYGITNVPNPSGPTDVATKSYVDGYVGWNNASIASNAGISVSKLSLGASVTGEVLMSNGGSSPSWSTITDASIANGVISPVKLSAGTDGQVLKTVGGATAWATNDATLAAGGAGNVLLGGASSNSWGKVSNSVIDVGSIQVAKLDANAITSGYVLTADGASSCSWAAPSGGSITTGSANTVYLSSGSSNAFGQIKDAYVASDAAIAVSKLASGTDNYYLKSVSGVPTWAAGSGGGVSAHADLTGLSNDDHTQYLLANGSRNLTGGIKTDGYLAFRTNPAATGDLRLPSDGYLKFRNEANNADIQALTKDGYNNVLIGGGTECLRIYPGVIESPLGIASLTIRTASVVDGGGNGTGATLFLTAGDGNGSGNVGGNIQLYAGVGQNSATDGKIQLLSVVYMINVAAPSSNPPTGGYLYVQSGSLRFRGSSGTVTTIAPA